MTTKITHLFINKTYAILFPSAFSLSTEQTQEIYTLFDKQKDITLEDAIDNWLRTCHPRPSCTI